MSIHDHSLHERMVTACRAWLDWCGEHQVDPLDPGVAQLRRAAADLKSAGATGAQIVDMVDQVGFMTGVWRTTDWLELRRSI
ncbi:hypothetical protein [Cellulomonas endometrii]|uniref:hypothetical protein n=1 Tax=Cellulomonas endometrii TaxID=3036301 RepID=UPI0024AD0A3F|nr:hypothetical protein [Cellulomonas endometrii]